MDCKIFREGNPRILSAYHHIPITDVADNLPIWCTRPNDSIPFFFPTWYELVSFVWLVKLNLRGRKRIVILRSESPDTTKLVLSKPKLLSVGWVQTFQDDFSSSCLEECQNSGLHRLRFYHGRYQEQDDLMRWNTYCTSHCLAVPLLPFYVSHSSRVLPYRPHADLAIELVQSPPRLHHVSFDVNEYVIITGHKLQ